MFAYDIRASGYFVLFFILSNYSFQLKVEDKYVDAFLKLACR